jgi:hypothetical protein
MTYNFPSGSIYPAKGKITPLKTPGEPRICNILSDDYKKILIINIDKCLPDNESKCDYLTIQIEKHKAHFIELKGKDVKKAVKQIINTSKIISDINNKYISKPFIEKIGYIIPSAVPLNTKKQKIQDELGRAGIKYGGMKCNLMEISL